MPSKKSTIFLIIFFLVLSLVLMIKMYFRTRLELVEARNLITNLFYKDTVAHKLLREGKYCSALDRLSTNQKFISQYVVRRKVVSPNIKQYIRVFLDRGDMKLSNEERKWFEVHEKTYEKWDMSGWIYPYTPFMHQIETILYSRWADRFGLWTTWKPDDLATNIKLGSTEERPGHRPTDSEGSSPLSEKLYLAVGGTGEPPESYSRQNAPTNSIQEDIDMAIKGLDGREASRHKNAAK